MIRKISIYPRETITPGKENRDYKETFKRNEWLNASCQAEFGLANDNEWKKKLNWRE